MGISSISVRGARQHNLKNIHVEIPRNTLTVITGLSGSGKSSLAFDTIYAEGQRRYVETLSAYARQFLDQMERPDVDSIDGLSPSIAIEQKTTSRSPRSTVGTITEIYDYLRLLVFVGGRAALSAVRAADLAAVGRPDRAAGDGVEARRSRDGAGADRSRTQRRVQEGAGQAGAAGLHAGAHRRRAAQHRRRRDQARQAQEPHHRTGCRSPAGEGGYRAPPGSVRRTGDEAGQRAGAGCRGGRRRAVVLVEAGLSRSAASTCRCWSRARSRSTAFMARVRNATAWAASTISIRQRSSPIGRSRCWTAGSGRARRRRT